MSIITWECLQSKTQKLTIFICVKNPHTHQLTSKRNIFPHILLPLILLSILYCKTHTHSVLRTASQSFGTYTMGPLRKHFLVFWGVRWTVPHPPMSCITLMQKLFFFLYFDNSDILCVGTTESRIWYIFAVRRWRGIKIYIPRMV